MTLGPEDYTAYEAAYLDLVRRTCRTVASRLGDMADLIVVVGGLVPSLLIDQTPIPEESRHIGTRDLDIVLALSLVDEEQYDEIAKRLALAGFQPDKNEQENPTPQRWVTQEPRVIIEFLIEPGKPPNHEPRRVWKMSGGIGAYIIPGVSMAFVDYETIDITGPALDGAIIEGTIRVCGPGAFTLLKSLAFGNRHKDKDAYDLIFMLERYPLGLQEIANRIKPLLVRKPAQEAIEKLESNFRTVDHMGPHYAARFVQREDDMDYRADVRGFVQELLRLIRAQ